MNEYPALKQKAILGITWNGIERISVQIVSFIVSIILARSLTPDDFGIIGMIIIFIGLSSVIIDSGITKALIQKQNRTEQDFSTAFIFNIVISLIIYIILFFCAPLIAVFYDVPLLIPIIRILCIAIIINSLAVVQNAQLMIAMNFKKIFIVNIFSIFFSGLIAIIAVYNHLGVWSLVIHSLARSFISMSLFWLTGRWYPRQFFSFQAFKKLFNYGSKLLIAGIYGTILNNVYNVAIGRYFQQGQLGYFTKANEFGQAIPVTITSVVRSVSFPLLASLQNNSTRMVEVYQRVLKITAVVIFPTMIGLSLLSEQIISVILTEEWLPSAELLFWASLSFIFLPMSSVNMNMLNVVGRSDLFLKLDLSKLPLIILVMFITIPMGIKAMVIGNFITSFASYFINAYLPGKLFGYGPLKQVRDIYKVIIASGGMALSIIFMTNILNDLLILVIGIPIGALIYILALFLLKEKEFFWIVSLLRNRIRQTVS